jgi:hypothetical protein
MSVAYMRALALACVLPSLEGARSVTSGALEIQDGLICSVNEEPDQVQYGIRFSVDFPGGCNKVKCGKYFFSTVLPKMMNALQEKNSCNCHGTGIFSPTGETSLLLKFRSKLANSCTPEECWSRYSKAMYLAKKVDNPALPSQESLARPEHWTLQCVDDQDAINTGLPTLVEVAAELNEKGGKYAEAVQDIIQQAAITGLGNSDVSSVQQDDLSTSPVIENDAPLDIVASAPSPEDDLADSGSAPSTDLDSVDELGSAPSTDLADNLDVLGSAPSTDLEDNMDGLGSASSTDLENNMDGLGSAPSTDLADNLDVLGSAPSTDLPDSIDGLGSAPSTDLPDTLDIPGASSAVLSSSDEEEEDPSGTGKCDALKDDVSYAVCVCGLANKRTGPSLNEQCRKLSLPVKQRTLYWTCSTTKSRGKKSCAAKMQLSR